METIGSLLGAIRNLFAGPEPQEQLRKCSALIETSIGVLDHEIVEMQSLEAPTKKQILARSSHMKRMGGSARKFMELRKAKELATQLWQRRRVLANLATAREQLTSLQIQVNEAFELRKVEGRTCTTDGVLQVVKSLLRFPLLASTMRELTVELMKAGIIEGTVGETMLKEDPETEEEPQPDHKVVWDLVLEIRNEFSASAKQNIPPSQTESQKQTEEQGETGEIVDRKH
ncbi:Vacuolar protein sorting-associated protein 24 [Madurella mycetomatis]|uniref:Vacuolar protein sorting-associated protein 24 n=1 Tax=Madurella mycetomatis TaxID=100816 RepID=A0A175W9L4_9PEZI|nr:Vacuolar protein sorting-associated protein 24 [Madurella mycetomatis]